MTKTYLATKAELDALAATVAAGGPGGGPATIADVTGLQAALDALQASATAATDAELASAVATLQAAVNAKQDLASAATDAELASAVATINASMATDVELAAEVATLNAAIASISGGSAAPRIVGTPAANLGAAQTVTFAGAEEVWLVGILNANLTVTVNTPIAGSRMRVIATQDATGGRTLTVAGQAITIPTTPSGLAMVLITWLDAATFRVESAGVGGFANPMTTGGDLIVGGGSGSPQRLAPGVNGQVLSLVAGSPGWQDAGGGLGGSFGLRANDWHRPPMAAGTNVNSVNARAWATPFVAGRSCTIEEFLFQIQTTAGSAGSAHRVAIYTDVNGRPGVRVGNSSDAVDTTTLGLKSNTSTGAKLGAAVVAGQKYWIVLAAQGNPTTLATVNGSSSGATNPMVPIDGTNIALGVCLQFTSTGAFDAGALSADLTSSAGSWAVSSTGPAVAVRAIA